MDLQCRVAFATLLVLAMAGHAQAPAPADIDPAVAAEQVSRALRATPGIPAGDVVVSTHAGTVVLSGEVGSEVEAARAIAAAEGAAGGMRVSSQMSIRPDAQQSARDQALQLVREVEQALRQDPRTGNLGVAVSVDDAQVIGLHGLVPSRESRALAEEVAARAAGATRLRSHLVIPGE